jgi:hypothetical protein
MDVKLRQFVRTRAGQHCECCGLQQEFSLLRRHAPVAVDDLV